MERCVVIRIKSVDIGMSIKKELDALMIALDRGMMKRYLVIEVAGVDIGTMIKKELDALMMAIR